MFVFPCCITYNSKFVFDTDYKLAAGVGKCTESDGSMITTEAECKKACNSLENINAFRVGEWPDSPGCFFYGRNRNCHWNKRKDVKWGARAHRAVCGPKKETVGKYVKKTL